MKLLKPFQVGDIVRMNYRSPGETNYRIVNILEGCTCPNYVDLINNHDMAKSREAHVHFTCVLETEPPTKSGTYSEHKQYYLGAYVYRDGECVDVDGPNIKGTSGWHDVDDGLDKVILVRAAAHPMNSILKLLPTKTKRRTTTPNEKAD